MQLIKTTEKRAFIWAINEVASYFRSVVMYKTVTELRATLHYQNALSWLILNAQKKTNLRWFFRYLGPFDWSLRREIDPHLKRFCYFWGSGDEKNSKFPTISKIDFSKVGPIPS